MYSDAENARSMLRDGIYDGLNVASVSVKYTSAIAYTSPPTGAVNTLPPWFQVRAVDRRRCHDRDHRQTRDRVAMDSHFVSPDPGDQLRYSADDLR